MFFFPLTSSWIRSKNDFGCLFHFGSLHYIISIFYKICWKTSTCFSSLIYSFQTIISCINYMPSVTSRSTSHFFFSYFLCLTFFCYPLLMDYAVCTLFFTLFSVLINVEFFNQKKKKSIILNTYKLA